MKQYKFQALVTLYAADGGPPCPKLDAAPRRMVLRGRSDESGRSQFFSALVSQDGDMPVRSRNPRLEVILRVAGDDVAGHPEDHRLISVRCQPFQYIVPRYIGLADGDSG